VQAALDKVSRDRTTITIAHRLSTVKKADNIIVLRKGTVVQQGTHEALMANEGGEYWNLATAQQLLMYEDNEGEDTNSVVAGDGEVAEKKSMATIGTDSTLVESAAPVAPEKVATARTRGFWESFGLLLKEQMSHWGWYFVLFLASIGGGGESLPPSFLSAVVFP
jgi:ATP-binding cassette subfamily B (MDR/TAP) protein 1